MFRKFAFAAACVTVAFAGISTASAASPDKNGFREVKLETKAANTKKQDCPFRYR
jgi:hypothetical protein